MGQERVEPAWPTVTYRSRLQDTILAVVFSTIAAGMWVGSVWALVIGEWQPAGILVLMAVVWTGVAWFLQLNRRQHVVLTESDLVIQRRLERTRIPYAEITNVTVGFVRGVVVVTEDGVTGMLPWPPMRTASGGGLSRAREVHDELSRRVAATRAGAPR